MFNGYNQNRIRFPDIIFRKTSESIIVKFSCIKKFELPFSLNTNIDKKVKPGQCGSVG